MKLTKAKLNKIILETVAEIDASRKPRKRRKSVGTKAFRESTRKALSLISEATEFTGQSNFKDFDDAMIDDLFDQINSKDPEASIYKAMEFTPQDDDGNDLPAVKPDVNKVAAWLESKGEAAVRERIKMVGGKIPARGLPKADMPFLPGPPDASGNVKDVVDALTPGGDYNVSFAESKKSSDSLIVERWNRLAGIREAVTPPAKNTLEPGAAETEEYMKSGHPENDGDDPGNDNANVQVPATVAAADAVPTQSNILLPKALGMAVAGVEGGDLGAYFSTNNEILDGHHRWAATSLNNPAASLGGFAAVDLDAMGGTTQALKHLTAIGNALGNKTKTA